VDPEGSDMPAPRHHRAPAVRCGSHASGHDPHTIQVLRVAPLRPAEPVHDLRIEGIDTVVLTLDGGEVRRRNHQIAEVLDTWGRRTGTTTWTPGARLLQIEVDGSFACFDLAEGDLERCSAVDSAVDRAFAEIVARSFASSRRTDRPSDEQPVMGESG